jgi:hypothetical protein
MGLHSRAERQRAAAQQFQESPSKKIVRPHLTQQAGPGMVGHTVIPATQEADIGRPWFKTGLRQKHKTLSEK